MASKPDTKAAGAPTNMAELAKSELAGLHAAIDARAREVAAKNKGRLHCERGCSGCCVDDLTVFEVEAARIRAVHPELLKSGVPHAAGACAFLDSEGACRVYDVRPYVCRTQGLPLRWLELEHGLEHRDICVLNDEPVVGPWPTIVDLPIEACWTLGPAEERLSQLQRELCGDEAPARVKLRDLFSRLD